MRMSLCTTSALATLFVRAFGFTVVSLSAANLNNISPPSGLLAPGTQSIRLQFTSSQADTCRYSVAHGAASSSVQPAIRMEIAPTAAHSSMITGLSSDPRTLNTVSIACDSSPTDVTTLTYRAVTAPNGSYPRIGSIWIGNYIYDQNLTNAEKIQLYLGAGFTPAQATTLRNANANVIILPSTNTVEARGYPHGVVYDSITLPNGSTTAPITVPDASYYLYDIHGNPISDWPGDYLLNLTSPKVGQFLGQAAYQVLSSTNFAFDGIFFDNFYTSISWFTTDVNGNPVQISSQNNGVADNPSTLDAAWGTGAYSELATFRGLAPNAYTAGHLGTGVPAGPMLDIFNGNSLVFAAVNVRENTMDFGSFWNLYQTWSNQSQTPSLTMVQSSPPNQIAYGYGYAPIPYSGTALIPAATATFGQTFYPNMRFGLASALMNDGFFTYDFGDTGAPVNWWFDEYNFNLGTPLGAAQNISGVASVPQLSNGSFENGLSGWNLSVNNSGGDTAAATVSVDSTTAAQGNSSALIDVTSPTTVNWHISFIQSGVALVNGTSYQLSFWAKSNAARTIYGELQGGSPNYVNYYSAPVTIGTTWRQYNLSFTASATDPATQLEFFVGGPDGQIWLDGVQFGTLPPGIFRRDFTNGTVLLNGTSSVRTISLGSGFQRLSGSQAPLYQYIVDDTASGFSTTGSWNTVTIDTGYGRMGSGETPNPPYYHAWNGTAQTNTGSGTAQWPLNVPGSGTYTIQAWLPAAPTASTWSKNAIYQVMAGTSILATGTIDQTTAAAGDGWHTIATVGLNASAAPYVKLSSGDGLPLLADALYLTSVARFNDGSPASTVTLQPMDGILLQKQTGTSQTISFGTIGSQTTGTTLALSATASSGLPVTFTSSTTNVCTVSGSTATSLAAGSCTITASQAGNGTYNAATPISQSFSVYEAQTITFPIISSGTVGSTIALGATAGSGLAVSYSSSTSGVCAVSGGTASLLTIGACTITAAQDGNATYAPATPVSMTFTVDTATASVALRFIPVTPCRVADTRSPNGALGGPELSAGSERAFPIPNSSCGIPSTAAAYSLNVTAVPSSALSYLAIWPTGSGRPLVSTLNSDSRVKANAAIVAAGTNGGVSVYVSDASHVILDINGYFVPASNSTALEFYKVAPCRVADTRNAKGALGGPYLAAGSSRTFPVLSSSCGLPAVAQAYSLNFTAVPYSAACLPDNLAGRTRATARVYLEFARNCNCQRRNFARG